MLTLQQQMIESLIINFIVYEVISLLLYNSYHPLFMSFAFCIIIGRRVAGSGSLAF